MEALPPRQRSRVWPVPWFSPKTPNGKESNWVQTKPGKSFNAVVRLYGALQPWFDKTWKPGDFELVK